MQKNTPLIVYIQLFAVLNHLLSSSEWADSQSINIESSLLSDLTRMGLRSSERRIVSDFFKKPTGSLPLNFRPDNVTLKDNVQSLYELLCEVIGPVETDKLFGRAIQKVSTSLAGQAFSPNHFL